MDLDKLLIHNIKITNQLKITLNEPHFEKWNYETIEKLKFALQGKNGSQAQLLAEQLSSKFYIWILQNNKNIFNPFSNTKKFTDNNRSSSI